MDTHTHIVIMAGGIGSRLWPASTPAVPKQFIDLLGVGKSLIQLTVERFLPVCDYSRMWVVTSVKYAEIVKAQLPMIPESHILSEPEPRNTAPCIAYACWKIKAENPDANVVVTPSDAVVLRKEKFADCIRKALDFTAERDCIVTVGIHPDRPETGYGYICSSSVEEDKVLKVNAFKEKPDRQTAEKYLAAGNYFWNAGIFVWSVNTIVSQLRLFVPGIAGIMDRIASSFGKPEENDVLNELFPQCEKISIDYAVMERSESIYVIASDVAWSDLGSWSSVGGKISGDNAGNKVVGDGVRLFGCEDCVVNAADGGTVVVSGLKNYVVAVKDGNILVCPLTEDQKIKDFLA